MGEALGSSQDSPLDRRKLQGIRRTDPWIVGSLDKGSERGRGRDGREWEEDRGEREREREREIP